MAIKLFNIQYLTLTYTIQEQTQIYLRVFLCVRACKVLNSTSIIDSILSLEVVICRAKDPKKSNWVIKIQLPLNHIPLFTSN